MKKFDEFFDKIEEALNNPVPITWNKETDRWLGTFDVENNHYDIEIAKVRPEFEHYYFKFKANDSYDLTNDPTSVFRVVPTIDIAATNFLHEVLPEALFFFATDKSMARRKMYERYCEKIIAEGIYKCETRKFFEIQNYILWREECDRTELQRTVGMFAKQWTGHS